MSNKKKGDVYLEKVFINSRKCLREAEVAISPYANKKSLMKNPSTGSLESVMEVKHAINWCLKHHVAQWRSSTWRLIRSSYKYFLDEMVKEGKVDKINVEQIYSVMLSVKGKTRKEIITKKTSSKRKKAISEEELNLINAYIKDNNSDWGTPLLLWLKAGAATGLRPNEWTTALMDKKDGRSYITVDNFKHNENRSYAKVRTLDLTSLGSETIALIANQIEMAKQMQEKGIYSQYYTGCRGLLYRINKKVFPRRKKNIQLYTGRHQFSANAKADENVGSQERAAMMGHKTTVTSEEGYGRTQHGKSGKSPEIGDREVLNKIHAPERKVIGQKINLS